MINKELLQPKSIVVIGGSNNVHKPGGTIVRNIINGGFSGTLHIVNPKEDVIRGIKVFHDVKDIPPTDLAILVVAAKYCPPYVEYLASEKQVRAFIIISAGFGETTPEGELLEQEILSTCEHYGCALIGPNCIGLLTQFHHSVFTKPIPTLNPKGVDFISGSGATAVFILESAVTKGLSFNSVWSIGNGKQIGIETVLEYMDEHFDAERDSLVKLLYIENISDPDRLLLHATSLIRKGCRIAAIKAGSSERGSIAASSHTGAIASSDSAVEALFRKAGIVRCFSREELTTVGCIFTLPHFTGKNVAIVTHAGGPGVMLTDALSKGGMEVPPLDSVIADELQQLGIAIDYCEHKFDNIDAIMVIFGTPGLVQLYEAYDVLHNKILECKKPIFPILPCLNTAGPEVHEFIMKGHVNFSDEVTLATALTQIMRTPKPAEQHIEIMGVDVPRIRRIIDNIDQEGYIEPRLVHALLESAGIPTVPEFVSSDKEELLAFADKCGFPVVLKVVGPVHKSDVGGVTLNIRSRDVLSAEYARMMQIEGIGAKYEPRFGHVVLCGLGGIFVEILKDVSSGLAPLSYAEAESMIRSLRGFKILKGARGKAGINIRKYAEIIVRLSTLLRFATEIKEMDINPLIADENSVIAVDARIYIGK